MDFLPASFTRLVEMLGRLPSVGPKTALRMAGWVLRRSEGDVEEMARALITARRRVRPCGECGFHSEIAEGGNEEPRCAICADPAREEATLLVVEAPADVLVFERMGRYRGRYHVLGGRLSPVEGIGPEALSIPSLLHRARKTREVILALDADAEGEATALYLARLLEGSGAKVTRLAQGLPVGGDLEYADEATLSEALAGRRGFSS